MLTVKTHIKPSKISGVGLFADEFIHAGTTVWKFEPLIDILLTVEEISRLSEPAQKAFHNYAFLEKKYGKWMLCGDDGRFFNHSDTPNCDDSIPDVTTAIKDIEIGEELTVNYKDFYADIDDHKEIS